MTINHLPPPAVPIAIPAPAGSYLREAQLQLDEVLSGYDPADADPADSDRFEAQMCLAVACAQLAQAEVLASIASTMEEALSELRTLQRKMGGPS
ncbi:hypothetical protein [Nonomuraea dietziae]|uniref:hypothetical protein n=1 Tax=Nonomuraea dietziae TaxID=65515 RepID=UPI003426F271